MYHVFDCSLLSAETIQPYSETQNTSEYVTRFGLVSLKWLKSSSVFVSLEPKVFVFVAQKTLNSRAGVCVGHDNVG